MKLHEWQTQAHKLIRSGQLAEGVFEEQKNLPVYARGFRSTVNDSLASDFSLLLRLAGKKRFVAAVDAWLEKPRGYLIELRALAPAFLRFLEARGEPPAVLRAARLDILAEEARIAVDHQAGGRIFGLHPSVRFLEDGKRRYCIWRQDGGVCRERLSPAELKLLRVFSEPAELAEISGRLERASLEASFVQEAVAVWSESSVIVSYRDELPAQG